jgi:ribonuclease-3
MINKIKDVNSAKLKVKKLFNYTFKNETLLLEAFSHKSFSKKNYERLEFLGDAVIRVVISNLLFKKYPKSNEGELSRETQILVSKKSIAKLSNEYKLVDALLYKNLKIKSNTSLRTSISANLMESLIGAFFVDAGYIKTEIIIKNIYKDLLKKKNKIGEKDSKTKLQEYMQSINKPLPIYETKRLPSPPHKPKFEIICKIDVEPKLTSHICSTVQEGQQKTSKFLLNKIKNEK